MKRILLGISGGIAAYKSAELVRLLRKNDYEVRVVMTHAATQFITPLTLQALSGHAVHTQLLDASEENAMGHINLARWAELFLIAPASANCMAKLSLGIADNLLSTLYLAAECPVYIAPAMNQAMWSKPVTQENLNRLQQHKVHIIGPETGSQACGETGYGRMSEPSDIITQLGVLSAPQLLLNKKVLISAGPTHEALDPVRYITNRSSGKMGYALAQQAQLLGAKVTLVSGPTQLVTPKNIHTLKVKSAAEMYTAVMQQVVGQDIFISAAAVADYTPEKLQTEKIKKQDDNTRLSLCKTQDIVASVANLPNKPFTVGFAAETHNLERYALDKLQRKNLDMIAANWVGKVEGGFDSDRNALQVYWQNGKKTFAMTDKTQLANQLLTLIAERLNA
ncbi:bifunctional phosphopantothenoylcysteine decarboxylase/phosphopantothenate--cysteine ligase CoaBC [methanotrophic endosymbiont of Bathymodiolus puteoserpentis (Logatchev)]|uniref:bifunctional phosphopantothenoylcysteine decarboxylase/phosphopantothenate--cysteine ligase CoaBC n=1 Tax=methanotrophic endosymbiont of Bathymodiolus puteoserpentis (Logatchev) TaxID=343235 RepID=UPI0013CB2892|nr:bifunctional phosphopantothenoylcysteine decarboxylase/phosphopantothenate--cysteine ligase CoaBC [methanotrophic endosymbiont of Bathymodiolus puteoserpentis (Logatchev)]SHE22563.1 Phosphopantothenoylcysteine decarboxylase / Phosphopantothenoylcysteine synthetase [methanotrophic endosymbiont of Bathymodiolus puteoserpentis (Logatchev)]